MKRVRHVMPLYSLGAVRGRSQSRQLKISPCKVACHFVRVIRTWILNHEHPIQAPLSCLLLRDFSAVALRDSISSVNEDLEVGTSGGEGWRIWFITCSYASSPQQVCLFLGLHARERDEARCDDPQMFQAEIDSGKFHVSW